MSHPQDPEATSVITWGRTDSVNGSGAVNGSGSAGGRHHAAGDGAEPGFVAGSKADETSRTGPIGLGSRPADEVLPAVTGEAVTCPECGTAAHVTLNRRESLDFCRTCDYPLFWAPQKILRGNGAQSDESLRRLPGQSGRVSIASLPCPHCSEPNALDAVRCIRCGGDMHPVAVAAPAPAPRVYVPPPAPEPEPERGIPTWVWVLAVLGAVAVIAIIVLAATNTITF